MIYEYDIDNTALFGTANNRLMTESLLSTAGMASTLLSTKYYYYTFAGNVERVVTELASPGNGVPKFSAVRFDYAANAQIATYVVGESWDVDADLNGCPDSYTVTFAREFRYDGARQRYLDRMLDEPQAKLGNVVPVLSTWTDYDGDNTYSDFTVSGNTVTDGTGYELGLAQINRPTPTTFDTLYAHNDHLGTLRGQSNGSGFTSFPIHTAFGEKMSNDSQRFGYAGSSGYQTNTDFDSLHVGARYYDPSSGRFLQRDPIGINGGSNVYVYVSGNPLAFIDPMGLDRIQFSGSDLAGYMGAGAGAGLTGGYLGTAGAGVGILTGIIGGAAAYATKFITLCSIDIVDYQIQAFVNNRSTENKRNSRPDVFPPKTYQPIDPTLACLVTGTLVQTMQGPVPIEDIKVGDMVFTVDFVAGATIVSDVIASGVTGETKFLVDVTIADDTLRSTYDHPYWTANRGWVQAIDLTDDDELETLDGSLVKIQCVNKVTLDAKVPVFDIRVSQHHWFYIGRCSVLVHNT